MGIDASTAMVRPLDDNSALIELIANTSEEPRKVVAQRLLDEEKCLGTNVRRDLKNAGVKPHVMSDELVEFYRTTNSFLYETVVWNRAPLKLDMRNWIGEFLTRNAADKKLDILSFGDGLGFDSVYLAMLGHRVTYFEVSEECINFAKAVFQANEQTVNVVQKMDELNDKTFDVVICLDVLEHVPNPGESVSMLSRLLRQDGWLLTHSPFFFTTYHRVTHLKSNRRYSGSTQLFTDHGLHPVDGRFFWDPIALQKLEAKPKKTNLRQVRIGGLLLKLGRYANLIHCLLAQKMAGTDKRWRTELAQILVREE